MADPLLPRPQSPMVDRAGQPTPEWYDFLSRQQESAEDLTTVEAQVSALEVAVAALEAEGNEQATLLGPASVAVFGTLEGGSVALELVNDDPSPGALKSYATDNEGAKGWYSPALFESTGVLLGGALSINGGDNTKFDLSQVVVGHVDYTSPGQPVRTLKVLGPFTAQTVTNIGTQLVTYVALDPVAETIVQQASPFTNTQRRDLATLGVLVHSNLTILNAVNQITGTVRAGINQLQDYLEFRGPLKTGIEFAPNGANLNLNRSAGEIFKFGANFQSNPDDPHVVAIAGQTALTFRYRTQNAEPAGNVTAIDPDTYDVGGVLTAVPANDWSVQHITVFQSGLTRIQYGQTTYAKLEDALVNYQSEIFVTEQNIAENGVFCCYLIVKEGATDLSNSLQARFINTTAAGVPSSPSVPLANTDDLAEGVVNLYFTEARVQATPLASYTVATLPAATPAGLMIYVTDESGGAVPAFSDSTNWRRVTDRAIVS